MISFVRTNALVVVGIRMLVFPIILSWICPGRHPTNQISCSMGSEIDGALLPRTSDLSIIAPTSLSIPDDHPLDETRPGFDGSFKNMHCLSLPSHEYLYPVRRVCKRDISNRDRVTSCLLELYGEDTGFYGRRLCPAEERDIY